MEQVKVYVVAYKDAEGDQTHFEWAFDFRTATQQFEFAVQNSEGPGHSVVMYSGFVIAENGMVDSAAVSQFNPRTWREIGSWTDPRPVGFEWVLTPILDEDDGTPVIEIKHISAPVATNVCSYAEAARWIAEQES